MAGRCSTTACKIESRGRKGAKVVAHGTGKVLQKGVEVSEKVAQRAGPAAKMLVEQSKKASRKVKEKTLKAAKELESY